ncbi:Isoquinoline 1-oxidoreductase subunit alpha [Neolewinella maritima]|uniref:Isoquinoline 1-oxidoreductase subunit alpha n=1 Tax=Neolewinella maritima TaxID=1383882 RepID=A0ABN8F3B5_9BACT|nr:(2Fe-2S)-binding protein [Neolewinella maritima]CAH1001460.1 Isoquinoline 1-oxidoreductase subunit alpha [Neolewinella maritima]
MATYRLTVNGQPRTLEAEPEMPLLWALRDELGLVGTKYGCGIGACGACTVHLDGVAMRSCSLPLGKLNGEAITTIEGLSAEGDHPVQLAWLEHDVPQCGYCQAGQIMSAASLLNLTPDPSEADISSGMSGNICRCGTYSRIHAAVKTAAQKLS